MGKTTGFLEFHREPPNRKKVTERIQDWKEFYEPWSEPKVKEQGARCMNCGVPFCHTGCPLGNRIPEWNHLVYTGRWQQALQSLHATNNFPEFTGRICPAPCEPACVLSINGDPVTIEYIEKSIAEKGFAEGWIEPEPPAIRTGKRVAVVGSGPAGLACAQQLNRAGHLVTVFERDKYIGGLLTLGIPDFKLEKSVVQRRVEQLLAEGVEFRTEAHVGVNVQTSDLLNDFDAVCLTGGATMPRDLNVPGRELDGVYFAVTYLSQQNKLLAGEIIDPKTRISAQGKKVIILGGGDTGADCLGTAHRQGAASVLQIELLPEPPTNRLDSNPWPEWPMILRTSAAHEEGGVRDYSIATKSFSGINGEVSKAHAVRLDWSSPDSSGRRTMVEVENSEFEIEADLVLLALGFLGPETNGMLGDLSVDLTERGNVKVDASMMTSVPGVFAAGDMSRGQSLVVWAIAEGREAAHHVDTYLMGQTNLPRVLS
jgi:glutamate synthase (NADPH/NADH) small chain